ncbi:MAG: glutamate--tRNA ligase family protein, partial [Saprospiraceae bacterium]
VGNAFNFLLIWLAARAQPGAKLLLRIDDLDADRKRPGYVADIFDSLRWLGLDWDEGPTTPDDFEANWSQNLRIPLYQQALDHLRQTGLLYACAKSRQDLTPFDGEYPSAFRHQQLDMDAPGVAWRIATPPGFPLPDFIVRRKDGVPAYQLASIVDDLHFGITHVVRGADLKESTTAQLWLAARMDRPDFSKIRFFHHPLLRDDQGDKLSKSAGADYLISLRQNGSSPGIVFRQVGKWLGLSGTAHTAAELLTEFQQYLENSNTSHPEF